MAKPVVRRDVAIAVARSFAARMIQASELTFQRLKTTLSDEEVDVVIAEMERILMVWDTAANQGCHSKAA